MSKVAFLFISFVVATTKVSNLDIYNIPTSNAMAIIRKNMYLKKGFLGN